MITADGAALAEPSPYGATPFTGATSRATAQSRVARSVSGMLLPVLIDPKSIGIGPPPAIVGSNTHPIRCLPY